MSSPFTNRQPLTPAQKKIVVAAVLIVLIIAVSVGVDLLKPDYTSQASETAGEEVAMTETEEEVDESTEEETVEEEETDDAVDTSDHDVLAAGETYGFDTFSIENATDSDVSLDYDSIEKALLNLFSEEGYDGFVGETFSIVGTGTGSEHDGTSIDSVYIYTPCDDFHYLRLSRDNGYLDYSCVAMETSTAWLALMEFDGVDTEAAESLVSSSSSSSSDTEADSGTEEVGGDE